MTREELRIARKAALERVYGDESAVGKFIRREKEGENLYAFIFEAHVRGYENWQWCVSLYHDEAAGMWTLDEATLRPTSRSLLAPSWNTFEERFRRFREEYTYLDVGEDSSYGDDDEDDDEDIEINDLDDIDLEDLVPEGGDELDINAGENFSSQEEGDSGTHVEGLDELYIRKKRELPPPSAEGLWGQDSILVYSDFYIDPIPSNEENKEHEDDLPSGK